MKKIFSAIGLIFILIIITTACQDKTMRFIAGRYTEAGEKGMYLLDLIMKSGTVKELSAAEAGPNPSYFCISEKKSLIYAANEVMEFNGTKGGGVTTLKYVPETGSIEKVSELLVPFGGPCFISLTPDGKFLLMANYSSSSISVVKLDDKGFPEGVTDTIQFEPMDGKISHPHMLSFDPAGKKVYLTDLGLDRIVIYDFDSAEGRLKQLPDGIIKMAEGTGPRHFVFNASGTKMYVICELNSTISVFDVSEKGGLTSIQTLTTLGDGFTDKSFCADIHLGKNEQYIYGTNRGENTIVVFRLESDGKLAFAGRTSCGGNWPRNFVIDPSGETIIVGNQKSGDISIFKIDKKTGIPVYSEDYKLNTPACIKFLN
jgi:6-phosphogluconolactonase